MPSQTLRERVTNTHSFYRQKPAADRKHRAECQQRFEAAKAELRGIGVEALGRRLDHLLATNQVTEDQIYNHYNSLRKLAAKEGE